jgi:hypothetical protein
VDKVLLANEPVSGLVMTVVVLSLFLPLNPRQLGLGQLWWQNSLNGGLWLHHGEGETPVESVYAPIIEK